MFNIQHLRPYFVDNGMNSRASSFQPGEVDAGGAKSKYESNEAQLTDAVLKALDYSEKVDLRKIGEKRWVFLGFGQEAVFVEFGRVTTYFLLGEEKWWH